MDVFTLLFKSYHSVVIFNYYYYFPYIIYTHIHMYTHIQIIFGQDTIVY